MAKYNWHKSKGWSRCEKHQRKKIQARKFAERYNRTKTFIFPDKELINMVKHFNFPKFIVNGNLSNAALAVYPVICSKADFEEDTWIQLPQDHIAKMAGVSVNTVAKGIRDLLSKKYEGLLERRKETEGPRHYYMYKVGFIRREMMKEWKGDFFIFHTCIIDSGVWAKLLPRAKALYLAMRSEAKFEPELYSFVEDIALDGMALNEFYKNDYANRGWDVCEAPLTVLCRMVGINSSDIFKVVKQLEECRLVEKVEMEGIGAVYKVYLKPQIF